MEQQAVPKLGHRVGKLARIMRKAQELVARDAGISRISVNRFFRGHSCVDAEKFVEILWSLGIDVDLLIENKINNLTGEGH
jgi:hypothetical protein